MDRKTLLLQRLNEIGASLAQTGQALALIGLGSVGAEVDRLDHYSDLDFFTIVKAGHKARFINNLDWLSAIQPIAYSFQNTHDGHKLLYADGIFCEMAVFEAEELAHIPFAQGRVIWRDAEFDEVLAVPQPYIPSQKDPDWLIGEALTNLYVGLCRYHRGEKLSAARFIQGYAVDRVLELAGMIETEGKALKDPFMVERRFETRFPGIAAALPDFIQGYDRSRESAQAILQFLEQHFEVNPAMKQIILDLTT